jgi:hypothetical protein
LGKKLREKAKLVQQCSGGIGRNGIKWPSAAFLKEVKGAVLKNLEFKFSGQKQNCFLVLPIPVIGCCMLFDPVAFFHKHFLLALIRNSMP